MNLEYVSSGGHQHNTCTGFRKMIDFYHQQYYSEYSNGNQASHFRSLTKKSWKVSLQQSTMLARWMVWTGGVIFLLIMKKSFAGDS